MQRARKRQWINKELGCESQQNTAEDIQPAWKMDQLCLWLLQFFQYKYIIIIIIILKEIGAFRNGKHYIMQHKSATGLKLEEMRKLSKFFFFFKLLFINNQLKI